MGSTISVTRLATEGLFSLGREIQLRIRRALGRHEVMSDCFFMPDVRGYGNRQVFFRGPDGELRTSLDILKPDRCARVASLQNRQSERVEGSQRKIQDGEPVYLREFTNKRKWDSGEILQKLLSTNYKVRDNSGNELHRHIDQLKRRSRSSLVAPPAAPATNLSVDSDGSGVPDTDSIVLSPGVTSSDDKKIVRMPL
ncbi:hypothetical protein ACJJTC_005888 [Scirpophaga incertulas]